MNDLHNFSLAKDYIDALSKLSDDDWELILGSTEEISMKKNGSEIVNYKSITQIEVDLLEEIHEAVHDLLGLDKAKVKKNATSDKGIEKDY